MESGTVPLISGRPTVLILSAGTGGGHESVATAMVQALEAQLGSALQVVTAQPLGGAIDRCYNWMLNYAPSLWGACFAVTNAPALDQISARCARALPRAALSQLIDDLQPDLILSVHALCAQAVAEVLRGTRRSIPHHCVITDLIDIHRTWIAPRVDVFYVATDSACCSLRNAGVAPNRIALTGLPLRRTFWPGADRRHVFVDGPLRVLLMDGGRPGPALWRALRSLLGAGPQFDITVACGRNSACSDLLSSTPFCTVRAVPPEAVARAMQHTDLVITKAGSVTIAEALALGRPLVLHRAAPGQETSNPSLLEQSGAGRYAPTARGLAESVRHLAGDRHMCEDMAARAVLLGRPDAALLVAAHLCAVLDAGAPVQYPYAS